MADQRGSVESGHPRVGDQKIYVLETQGQLQSGQPIVGLKDTVIGAAQRLDHHLQQCGLFVGDDDMGPLVEAWWRELQREPLDPAETAGLGKARW
jgi:hypothetical protein